MNTEEIRALIYKLTEEGEISPKMLMYGGEIEVIIKHYEELKTESERLSITS